MADIKIKKMVYKKPDFIKKKIRLLAKTKNNQFIIDSILLAAEA